MQSEPTTSRSSAAVRDTSDVADDAENDISPTRVRIGLAIIALVIVVSIGVIVTVDEPAARFLFSAIIVIGVFQTWRIFRMQRRS
jgi:hypothetical protein